MSTETVEIIIRDAGGAETAVSIRGVGTAAGEAATEVEGLNSTLEMMATTLAGLGIGLEIAQFIEMADATQLITDRMSQFAQSSGDLEGTWHALLAISDEAHQSLDATADLYLKLTVAGQSLHVSQDDLLTITRVMSDELAVSGKSADEAGRALIGLTRALQSGTLSAQTLTSMMRTMPGLANLIAQSIYGVNGTVIQLQEGIKNGSVTVSQFFNAIIKGAPEAEAAAAKMTVTVNKAFVDLRNHLEDYIRSADSSTGITGVLSDVIETLATNIQPVIATLAIISLGLTAYGIAAGIAALASLTLGSSFAGIAMLATMAVVAFESLEGPLGLVTGLLIGLTGIAAINYFNSLSVAVRATSLAVATLALEFGAGFVAGIAIFVGAINLAIIALALFRGQGIQGAINAAKAFNDSLMEAAEHGVGQLRSAIGSLMPSLTNAQTAWKGSSEALNGLTNELIQNAPALAAHNAAVVGANTAGQAAIGTHTQHAAAVKNLEPVYKATNLAITATGGSIKTVTESIKNLSGGMDAFHQTITTVNGALTTTVEMTRNVDGALTATHETLVRLQDGVRTTTEMVRDDSGAWTQLGQTIEQVAIPSMDRAQIEFENLTMAAQNYTVAAQAAAAAAAAGVHGPGGGGGGGGGSMDLIDQLMSQSTTMDPSQFPQAPTSNIAGSRIGIDFASGGEFKVPGFAGGATFGVGGTGGQDSKLVQFMASPDETVSIRTPSQMGDASKSGGGPVHVSMYVNATDAASFGRNRTQIMAQLSDGLQRVNSKLGRG